VQGCATWLERKHCESEEAADGVYSGDGDGVIVVIVFEMDVRWICLSCSFFFAPGV
jgi:hypothetical protein